MVQPLLACRFVHAFLNDVYEVAGSWVDELELCAGWYCCFNDFHD